jgi:signal peptidase I
MLTVVRSIWLKKPLRWCITVTCAALFGIAAGHTVIGLSGSVSVVDGMSMAPTYMPGARVFTGPVSGLLERGDIVLVDDGSRDYALKRVVGLPGETLRLWRGYVFVNCRMLKEPYLPKYTYTFPDETTELTTVSLGAEEYFVLGDNRTRSIDSRSYGPVGRNAVRARVPRSPSEPRAYCVDYTLPLPGKRTIRPIASD